MTTPYSEIQAVNWSRLKLIEKSPAQFKYGYGDDSSGFTLGTAAHMAILEPERFETHYVVYPKRRQGKEWDAFEQAAIDAGKEVLSTKEHEQACAIRDAVRRHAPAMRYLTGGAAEQTLTWKLGDFDCKGKADYIGPLAIADLKSTKDCSPRGFAAACARYGYFGQAAWYADGNRKVTGRRLPFVIIAVESSAPYVVQVYRMPEHVIEAGREQYLTLLARLDYCQRNNWWGGYSEAEELDLEIPQWMEAVSDE